jgi:hypothetical protein
MPPANLTVIENSGVLVVQEHTLTGFDKVEVSDGFDVEIKRGDAFRVVTNVEENLLPYVQVSLEGDTLKVGIDSTKTYHMVNITKRAEVTLPELAGVAADFLSEVTVSGFESVQLLESD